MSFLEVVDTYWLYFLLGRYPQGPLGGLALTLLLVRTQIPKLKAHPGPAPWRQLMQS